MKTKNSDDLKLEFKTKHLVKCLLATVYLLDIWCGISLCNNDRGAVNYVMIYTNLLMCHETPSIQYFDLDKTLSPVTTF